MNALKEVEKYLKDTTLLFAEVGYDPNDPSYDSIYFETRNMDELKRFLSSIDYDNGFGTQYIEGAIYLIKDNKPLWLERAVYDGSEWWIPKTIPSVYEQ